MDSKIREIIIDRAKQEGFKDTNKPLGINTSAVAKKANMAQSTLHRILCGKTKDPSYKQLYKIFIALNLPWFDTLKNPLDVEIILKLKKAPDNFKKFFKEELENFQTDKEFEARRKTELKIQFMKIVKEGLKEKPL